MWICQKLYNAIMQENWTQECESQTIVDNDRYIMLVPESQLQGEKRELKAILRRENNQQLKKWSLVP